MFRNTYCLFSPEGRRGQEAQGLSRTLNNSQEVIKPLLDLVSANNFGNLPAFCFIQQRLSPLTGAFSLFLPLTSTLTIQTMFDFRCVANAIEAMNLLLHCGINGLAISA
jgi:hypothetical protein